jgi:amidohydrolase
MDKETEAKKEVSPVKETIFQTIDSHAERIKQLARWIGENPELGHEERMASGKLADELEAQGFRLERNVLGLETAFIGTYGSKKPGPTVAFLLEYDALPGIGHACGHHLICTMGLAAAIGVKSVLDDIGGTVRVYGTPAEETSGAKVPMAEAGLFDDVDAALMAHPFYRYEKSGTSLAMDVLQFEFFGKAAHAAANPEDGINALDGVLLLFQSINALRQQLRSDARIHGVITHGGEAPNIIPDYACARFYVRSAKREYTDEVARKVIRCAEGAAMQTGCSVKVSNYEYSYDEMVTNEPLSEAFTQNLIGLGTDPAEIYEGQDHGSLDMGNVSRRCPAIHPFVRVINEHYQLHTTEFRDQAMTEPALDSMITAAKALAGTAFDVITNQALLGQIRDAFRGSVKR